MKSFARSIRYEYWANTRVLDRLRATPVVDLRAVQIFAHILATQQLWLARIHGEDAAEIDVWPDWDLVRCAAVLEKMHAAFDRLERGLTDKQLKSHVECRDGHGAEYTTTVHDMLRHLNRHGVYHRGQITIYLKRSGGEPADTDYIAWVREREGHPIR